MEKIIRRLAEAYSIPYEKVKAILQRVRLSIRPTSKVLKVVDSGSETEVVVKRTGVGPINTPFGKFYLFAFTLDDAWGQYFALVKAPQLNEEWMPMFADTSKVILRIDSGCETGQRFHDNTCECSPQLDGAMKLISERGEGIIINIPNQDGRGKGLPFKLGTLELQEELKFDTVLAATVMLQLDEHGDENIISDINAIDSRTYAGCIAVLKFFDIPVSTTIELATNNPKKTEIFGKNGYTISSIPIVIPPTESTEKHLQAKQNHLGHYLFL